MAWMNQERKAERMPAIKAALKKYGMKGSVSVRDHMVLVVKVKSGDIDFSEFMPEGDEYIQVNQYWIEKNYYGEAKDFLLELYNAMLGSDYFDESDSMVDYFHCSHYNNIYIGEWHKPYICNKKAA